MSGREEAPLTVDRLSDLVAPCAGCIFWEVDPAMSAITASSGAGAAEKAAWLSSVLLEWGSAGRIVYVDGQAAGYLTYAPPHLVPRSQAFATTPASADAVLLMTARVWPPYVGQGLGRVLVQSAAKDVLRRGVRALEAFGRADGSPAGGGRGRADVTGGVPGRDTCLVPAAFLEAVGFRTVRDHSAYPRMRLDLRSVLSLREDVEQAAMRLISSVRVPALGQAAGADAVTRQRLPPPAGV